MTDDVKVLAEAIEVLEHMTFSGGQSTRPIAYGYLYPVLVAARSALETSVQVPAVDRETLGKFFERQGLAKPNMMASTLIASGLLRDVRDVQAEALEEAAKAMRSDRDDFYIDVALGGADFVAEWVDARAQAIREASND